MKDIPLRKLAAQASAGCKITDIKLVSLPEVDFGTDGAHRHDHYLFFLLKSGRASLMADFEEVTISTNELYYLLPGQVHYPIDKASATGWVVSIEAHLITSDCRKILDDILFLNLPFKLLKYDFHQFDILLKLLYQKYNEVEGRPLYFPVLNHLVQSFTCMVAASVSVKLATQTNLSRATIISQQFKNLVGEYFNKVKSPSEYAAMLNISEPYLNESVKNSTSFSVSYWITQEVILEAKRLLFYSELNINEIAYKLGFKDTGYFSRLFKKKTDTTPLAFRARYRK
jgi:AraC family transcriptional activator of pobA